MQSCSNYTEDCWLKLPCDRDPLTLTDVKAFFRLGRTCGTSIVYFDSTEKAVWKNKVKVLQIDSTCNIFFTQNRTGNFYYVYTSLLQNLIKWAASNTVILTAKGGSFLGNHITMGMEDDTWNVHKTDYNIGIQSFTNTGDIVLTNKAVTKYRVERSKNSLTYIDSKTIRKTDPVIQLWNAIVCSKQQQMNAAVNKIKYGGIPGYTKYRFSITDFTEIVAANLTKMFEKIKTDYTRIGLIRLPYVSLKNENRVIQALEDLILKSNINVKIINDHGQGCSFAIVNI